MSYWGFPAYVSVAEKKQKAARKLKELSKKRPNLKPVALEGSALARTWWGKAWNRNLEQYADYSNRLGRGRSYIRHGAVLDLKIEQGEVLALVQGSTRNPYSVSVKIQRLKKEIWQRIKTECEGTLESFQELLAGAFPKALGEIFISKEAGMFPAPRELSFSCSCPDWADMCKHVAATLYGVGVKLDEDPKLFFRLRDADIEELIKQAVSGKAEKLLEKAARKSSRTIEGESTDLSSVFGIEIEGPIERGKHNLPKAVTIGGKNKVKATPEKHKPNEKKGSQQKIAKKIKKEIAVKTALKKIKTPTVALKKKAVPKKGIKSTVETIKEKDRKTSKLR